MAAWESGAVQGQRPERCPNCGQKTVLEARPFCSTRCKEIDLGRWLSGAYFIPGGRTDEEADGSVRGDESEE